MICPECGNIAIKDILTGEWYCNYCGAYDTYIYEEENK